MGRGVNIPWVGESKYHGRRVDITWVGGRYTMGKEVQNTMGRQFDIPWTKNTAK